MYFLLRIRLLIVFLLCIISSKSIAQNFFVEPSAGDDWGTISSALASAKDGDRVVFSAGTYDISQPIFITASGIILEGAGRETTKIQPIAGQGYDVFHCLICIWNESDFYNLVNRVEVSKLTLDGSNNLSVLSGITAKLGTEHYIHDTRIANINPSSSESSGILLSSSSRTEIVNNELFHIGRNGIDINESDYVTVRKNTIDFIGEQLSDFASTGIGVELVVGSDYSIIEDNTIDAFVSIGGSSYAAIRNNSIGTGRVKTRYAGIEIAGSSLDVPEELRESSFIISGNSVVGATDPGGILNGLIISSDGNGIVKYGLVSNNTFASSDLSGIEISGASINPIERIFFSKNIVENSKLGGEAYEGDGDGATLIGNVLNVDFYDLISRNNDRYGFQLFESNGYCPDQWSYTLGNIEDNINDSVFGCNISDDGFGNYYYSGNDLLWQDNYVAGNGQDIQLSNTGFQNNIAPSIDISILSQAGNTIVFDVTISDDQNIHELLWDFGEGVPVRKSSSSNSFVENYTFTQPGPHMVTVAAWDDEGRAGHTSTIVTVEDISQLPHIQIGTVSNVSTDSWTTVQLDHSYESMIVVATPNYSVPLPPMVTRIRNAVANSFQVRLDRIDNQSSPVSGVTVHYLTVEEGVYNQSEHGIKLEAVKFDSTITDENNNWAGEISAYHNQYSAPVVLGQVVTTNDEQFSTFWSRGSGRAAPPSSSQLFVGKHVAEDPSSNRFMEAIGYIVLESGSGTIDGRPYQSGVSEDTVKGVQNSPPFTIGIGGVTNAAVAVLSSAGMDGVNGGWPILYGSNPVSEFALEVAIEEDQLNDSERKHTTEQVAYIVFGN